MTPELTCPCLLGNLSVPRGVCVILAALHCNAWSGVACQMPLAWAEKTIPETHCVPDGFCRMSDWTKWRRQEGGVGMCALRAAILAPARWPIVGCLSHRGVSIPSWGVYPVQAAPVAVLA